MARRSIGKKLKFEVFKRDSFTCQYCGRMAPDVILEVDHISSVKDGGTDDIMNLITACFDCNRGKGDRKLSDNQTIKQQQKQLKEINERREQLKLLLQWKTELSKFDEEQIDIINDLIREKCNRILSDHGRELIKKVIKKFGISEVIESTNISISQYYTDKDSVSKVIDYIPRICGSRQKARNDPFYPRKAYIRGIIHNRFGIYNEYRLKTALDSTVVSEDDAEIVIGIAKTAKNWTQFWNMLNDEYCSSF